MRAIVSGKVHSVLPVMKGDVQAMTKNGKLVHRIYVLQNGAGRAPSLQTVKFIGDKIPKNGDTVSLECNIDIWKPTQGEPVLTVVAFE